MPTPMYVYDAILEHYGVDANDENAAEQFFETLDKRFTIEERELIMDFMLAAESSLFDYKTEIHKLPKGK